MNAVFARIFIAMSRYIVPPRHGSTSLGATIFLVIVVRAKLLQCLKVVTAREQCLRKRRELVDTQVPGRVERKT